MNNQTTEESQKRLKSLLRRLFQFDVSKDLEFGIYRIMNQKRDEIEKFIEKDLIEKTEEAFQEYIGTSTETLQNQLEDLKSEINASFGAGTIDDHGEIKNYHDAPKVQKYANMQKELEQAELTKGQIDDVYNHVYEFFGRYFDKGDFISKLRYGGKDKYVIPYNGEEVMLHWANKDHYYIKTTEHFTDYEFKVGKWKIHFILTQAEVERNNIKGENRYFILDKNQKINLDEENKELNIFFQYTGLTDEEVKEYGKRNIQEVINNKVQNKIISVVKGKEIEVLLTKKDEDKIQLEKHLDRYVTKNTSDYFIHKNLKAFLERELDFYIKNEVLHLDEIANMDEGAIRQNMARVKAIKEIGVHIIEFLAQIEDFQKMLFEKKKLVLKVDYCMTLDMVPKELYTEIAQNKDQIIEWKNLFNLDEITNGTFSPTKGRDVLDENFLNSYPSLVLDTTFFSQDFKDKLLDTFSNLHEMIAGELIKSENWQALNLLLEKYKEKIKCIYIDPPYNTGSDEFVFKDNYQHSTWLTMMENRLEKAKYILKEDGAIFISIDNREQSRLKLLSDVIFTENGFVSDIAMINNLKGRSDDKYIATAHEHVLIYKKPNFETYGVPIPEEYIKEYDKTTPAGEKYRLQGLRKRGAGARREDRPNMFYPFYWNERNKTLSLDRQNDDDIEIIPKLSNGHDGRWRWGKETVNKRMNELSVEKVNRRNEYDIFQMDFLEKEGELKTVKPKSFWLDKTFSSDSGTKHYKDIMGNVEYPNPKSPEFIKYCIRQSLNKNQTVIDFFAGSGTTAQALMSLNTEDNGTRKYIMIEMGDYFDYVMMPRIEKLMYSKEWKDGKPTSKEGHSHMFKYIYLEQYEDALTNIVFRAKDKTIQETLETFDDYFVRYMLDYETRESPTRLVTDDFEDPFGYKIKTISGNEEKIESVDLVETFNYLLGLEVETIGTAKDGERYYKAVKGRKPDGRTVIVIWRNTEEIDYKKDKKFLEENFLREEEPDVLYVNGMCHVENSVSIEPDFKRLMGA